MQEAHSLRPSDIFIPDGVHPHDGREAELLTAGTKKIASFVTPQPVPEAVTALVESGICERMETIVQRQGQSRAERRRQTQVTITVIFLPSARQPAQRLLAILAQGHAREVVVTDELEREIGLLHGYSDQQIDIFLDWRKKYQESLLPTPL